MPPRPKNPPGPTPEPEHVTIDAGMDDGEPGSTSSPVHARMHVPSDIDPEYAETKTTAYAEANSHPYVADEPEPTPASITELFDVSEAGVRRILKVQGTFTNRLIGRDEDHWHWRADELELVAGPIADMAKTSKAIALVAGHADQVSLIAGFAAYVLRNTMHRPDDAEEIDEDERPAGTVAVEGEPGGSDVEPDIGVALPAIGPRAR